MNFQHHVQLLRVQLLCMFRLSQRALDYSIKGHQLGSSDFCRQVRSAEHRIGEYRRQIKYLCRQITMDGGPVASDFRFALAALRIDSALHRTYSTSVQMAVDTIVCLKTTSLKKCPDLSRFGSLVNSLMRLCTVALFEREPSYAETVIHSQELWRCCELIFDQPLSSIDQQIGSADSYVLTIAQALGVVAKQTHEIADAILFWLRAMESASGLEEDGRHILNFLFMGGEGCAETSYQLRPQSISKRETRDRSVEETWSSVQLI